MADCAPITFATVGLSLAFNTSSRNSPDTLAPELSLAVTRITRVPTSALTGVPLKVSVSGSKASHFGSG